MKKTFDYKLKIIGIIILAIGLFTDNKTLNLIGFISIIAGLLCYYLRKNMKTNNVSKKQINKLNTNSNSKKASSKKIEYFKEYLDNWIVENKNVFNDEYYYYTNNCCPGCGCVLENKINSSKNCPDCKKKIILRTNRVTSEKLLLIEERAKEYDKLDEKRKEILYFENIISKRIYIYKDYMEKFYHFKSTAPDPRNVVFPFINYVGSELDKIATKEYMKIVNLPESDMALKSFEVMQKFKLANMQYYLLAEISDYKGRKDVALDGYASAAYRGVQITFLEWVSNPYHKIKTIDFVGNVFPGVILNFLNNNGYTLAEFKKHFLEVRHPFVLPQMSNEESWNYVEEAIIMHQDMVSKEK